MKNKILIICLVVSVIILIPLFILWRYNAYISCYETIDYTAFGTFGDFYGGVIGTLFAIIGVYIVYKTYIKQSEDQQKNEIESRFFELLRLHNENVITLKNNDPDIFNIYIKFIGNFYKAIDEYKIRHEKNWESKEIVKLSYLNFFYGYIEIYAEKLKDLNISLLDILDLSQYLEDLRYDYNPTYKDFGIYFRQLFQTVNYINGKELLTYSEKYDYIKILRARLNIEEQYLLFLNSFIASGRNWEKDQLSLNDKLITKYNLIKNIPKEFNKIGDLDFLEEYPEVLYEFQRNNKLDKDKRIKLEKNYK
jgi:hypothetical protein